MYLFLNIFFFLDQVQRICKYPLLLNELLKVPPMQQKNISKIECRELLSDAPQLYVTPSLRRVGLEEIELACVSLSRDRIRRLPPPNTRTTRCLRRRGPL